MELSGTRGEELERLRAELAAAKSRLAATAAEIPPLKSRIESTNAAVVARQAEAAKKKAAADELRQRVDGARAELRRMRAEIVAARDAKDALEQRVIIRRQAARALQLAERAVAAETHALAWAAGVAAEQAARARDGGGDGDGDGAGEVEGNYHDVVALPARKLEELRRRVEAEERKAAARVEEAEAMRRAAKASRAAAVARLDAMRAKKREAAAAGELHGRDGVHNGDGKRSKRTPPTRSRSKKSCFSVKKLRSFLCAAAKA
jgi:chromosome segregation ATPase